VGMVATTRLVRRSIRSSLTPATIANRNERAEENQRGLCNRLDTRQ
jgi:hypothetical protein